MQPSGRVLWISKGPAVDECVAMDLSDFDKASDMLTSLGFEQVMALSKRRDIYFLGDDVHITLDDITGLGSFVELASMTDDTTELTGLNELVAKTALLFGLDASQLEERSYRSMLSLSQSGN